MKNIYRKSSHISEAKMREIIKCLALDLTATNTGQLTGISRQTINKYYDYFRKIIFLFIEKDIEKLENGLFELDESYFGAKRVRGKRDRGAAGKTPVFGIKKRDENKVFYYTGSKLFKRAINAYNTRKNLGKFNNSYRWLEKLMTG